MLTHNIHRVRSVQIPCPHCYGKRIKELICTVCNGFGDLALFWSFSEDPNIRKLVKTIYNN